MLDGFEKILLSNNSVEYIQAENQFGVEETDITSYVLEMEDRKQETRQYDEDDDKDLIGRGS